MELPLPFYWNIPLTITDLLKDTYFEAKRMQMQLKDPKGEVSVPKLKRSQTLVSLISLYLGNNRTSN